MAESLVFTVFLELQDREGCSLCGCIICRMSQTTLHLPSSFFEIYMPIDVYLGGGDLVQQV